jgi:hypothetical protein
MKEGSPIFATLRQAGQRIELVIWRSNGETWQPWFEHGLKHPFARLAATADSSGPTWLAFDRELWVSTGESWQKVRDFEGQTRQLLTPPAGGLIYVLVDDTIFSSSDNQTWASLPPPPGAVHLIDLQLSPTGALLALDSAGVLWQSDERVTD